jgi:hypothetical protein
MKLCHIAGTNCVTKIRDATRVCWASRRRFSHPREPASLKRALAAAAIVSWRGFFERSINCVCFQRLIRLLNRLDTLDHSRGDEPIVAFGR